MRNVHNWSPNKARNVVAETARRKSYTWSGKPPVRAKDVGGKKLRADTRRKRRPVDGCYAVIRKVAEHLRLTHRINPNSSEYKVYLKNAWSIRKLGGNDTSISPDLSNVQNGDFPASTKARRREVDVKVQFLVEKEGAVDEEGRVEEEGGVKDKDNEVEALEEDGVKESKCGEPSCGKTDLQAGLNPKDYSIDLPTTVDTLISPTLSTVTVGAEKLFSSSDS